MMNNRPRIAVLMATHNDGSTLMAALESLNRQRVAADVILIDDASVPPVAVDAMPNVRVLRLEVNHGLTKALNIGLAHALDDEYEFIGRMDADDICEDDRLQRQLAFLDERQDLAGVGSWAAFFDGETGERLFIHRGPTTHKGVLRALRSNNCILHPTWLFRRSVFAQLRGYNESFPIAQDYEFLARAVADGHRFENLPEVLLRYRVSVNGISVTKRRRQLMARLMVQVTHFDPFVAPCWIGIFRTVALFVVPNSLLSNIKRALGRSGVAVE